MAACPDAAAVERRLGQIREYIRVTSSLVDTMRNSEDEVSAELNEVNNQSLLSCKGASLCRFRLETFNYLVDSIDDCLNDFLASILRSKDNSFI